MHMLKVLCALSIQRVQSSDRKPTMPKPTMPKSRRVASRLAVLTLPVLATLAFATSARATVTHSAVSSPGAAFTFGDETLPTGAAANTRALTGTSDGNAADTVDIRCESPSTNTDVRSGVAVASDGTFATTVDYTNFEDILCNLIAVPGGTNPGTVTSFTGPLLGIGQYQLYSQNGTQTDHYINQPQIGASVDYDSLGSCGLCDQALYGPDHTRGRYLYYDNGAVYDTYIAGGTTHQGLVVDGKPAYGPQSAYTRNNAATNAPALSVTHAVDHATGDLTITEQDPISVCSDAGTGTTCPAFVPSGLEVDRTIKQNQSGRVVRIADAFTSTDSATHTFSVDYDEYNKDTSHDGFRFPGETAYAAHVDGDSIPGGSAAISTVGSISDMTAVPSLGDPVGSMTVSPAPDRYLFQDPNGFHMLFTSSVPAGGAKTIRQSFAMAVSESELDAYTSGNADQLSAPTVAITSPAANGSTVSSPSLPVSGTATDNVGVSTLSINGTSVDVSGGAWSKTLTLSPGSNTITAVATDAQGNAATATRSVTYTPNAPKPIATPAIATVVRLHAKLRTGVITVFTPLACTAAPTVTCTGKVALRTRIKKVVRLHGKRVTRTRIITIGTLSYRLGAGKTKTFPVRLTKTGRALLRKARRLTVGVTIVQGTRRRLVAHRYVTFMLAAKK